ncbi:MAG: hypothetical protein KDN19_05785 [Verrucomicrobiae bacterium]|nr:hypothetical protein [Verrucomicrobiae bacterium]
MRGAGEGGGVVQHLARSEMDGEQSHSSPTDPGANATEDGEAWETCALSGERRPRSQMLPYGAHYVAPEHKDAFIRQLETGESVAIDHGFLDQPLDGKIGTIFRQGFRLWKRTLIPFAIFLIVFWLPLDLIDSFVGWHHVDWGDGGIDPDSTMMNSAQYQLISTILNVVGGLLGEIFFVASLHRTWQGQNPDLGGDTLLALRRYFPVLTARLMSTIVILLGFLFLVIPAFFFAARLCVADVIATVEKKSGYLSVHRSFHLSTRRLGTCFLFGVIVIFLLSTVPNLFLDLAWESIALESWVVSGLVSWVFTIPAGFVFLFLYVLYRHLNGLEKERETGNEPGHS